MNITKPQKLIYDMEKYAGGAISVICGGMLICGKKEISEMQRAVNELYRLNDALRIRIIESGGTVRQEITEYAEKSIPVLRFENKAELDAYAEKYAKTPLNLDGAVRTAREASPYHRRRMDIVFARHTIQQADERRNRRGFFLCRVCADRGKISQKQAI